MSIPAILIGLGFLAFLAWAIPSFIRHVFFPKRLNEPVRDERSSIVKHYDIIGRDYSDRH